MENEKYAEYEEYGEYEGSHHKKPSLYDTFVPFSHGKGYTWAYTTTNIIHGDMAGFIIHQAQQRLTQPNQRTLSREARTGTLPLPAS